MSTVTKAVIAAAGLGTRMYPITKVIDKPMLPLGRFPAIDFVVRECVAAGVTEIAIVTRQGSTQIRDYYIDSEELLAVLAARGWSDKIKDHATLPPGITITFREQSLDETYGTAVPVLLAGDFIGADSFFYVSSDDLLFEPEGISSLGDLAQAADGGYGIIGHPAPPNAAGRYGSLRTRDDTDGLTLVGLLEKTGEAAEPARPAMINISRYVFPADFVNLLSGIAVDPGSGELRLTDGIVKALDTGQTVVVRPSRGTYFDLGSAAGYSEAYRAIAPAWVYRRC